MVDVCLVVEGSYPYVTGGVGAWTQGLLEGLPEVGFTVAHVRDAGAPALPAAYAPPPNASVVHVELDPDAARPPAGAEDRLPEARVYHAACTGSAAELARRAAAQRDARFAVTEHGIAWQEARWGLVACKGGIQGCKGGIQGCKGGIQGELRPWTPAEHAHRAAQIAAMARAAYREAGAVTSVCAPNARLQARAGAPLPRLAVLPNPVAPHRHERVEHEGFLAGFVGRLVEVKDVLTYLEACALVAERRPDSRFLVVGPMHHEPAYARRCVERADELGLAERVTFTGEADPQPWLARMDALVLTSRSEAQPLVALEAMAAGVPVVATDVGGCREAIADAGLLTAPRDPAGTARALLRLAGDELLRARLGAAGRRRAAEHHDPARIHGGYRRLYERLAA